MTARIRRHRRLLNQIRSHATEGEGHPWSPVMVERVIQVSKVCAAVLPIAATVTYTVSGTTTLRASRERLATSLLSMSESKATARRLTLAWGVHSVEMPAIKTVDAMSAYAGKAAVTEGVHRSG